MGATTFQTYGFGKDLQDAFRQAREDAAWEYGHGGYTGTIAEKPSAVLFALPPRVKPQKYIEWIDMLTEGDTSYIKEELARLKRTRAKPGQGEAMRKRRAELAKEIKRAERELAKIPAQFLPDVRRAAGVYEDKWGSAVAFEINGTDGRRLKERHGLKGTRKRVFLFCGWASC